MNATKPTMRIRIFAGIITGIIAMLLVGCATFSGGELEKIQAYPKVEFSTTTATTTASLPVAKMQLSWYSMGKENQQVLEENWEMRDEIYNVAMQSGLFSSVGRFEKNPDYHINVVIHNHGNFSIALTVLCGLSLTVLPAFARDEWDVSATVTDASGKTIKKYEYNDYVVTWIELLLIFATPFTANKAEQTVINIFKHLFAQMIEDGVITPVPVEKVVPVTVEKAAAPSENAMSKDASTPPTTPETTTSTAPSVNSPDAIPEAPADIPPAVPSAESPEGAPETSEIK